MGGDRRDGKAHQRIEKLKAIKGLFHSITLRSSFLPRFVTHSAESTVVAHRQRDPVLEEVVGHIKEHEDKSVRRTRQQVSECCV